MAVYDNLLVVGREQSFAGTGNMLSTDYVPLQAIRDMGPGSPLYLEIEVTEKFTGGTSVRFGAGIGLAAPLDAGAVNVGQTEDILTAFLTVGAKFWAPISAIQQQRLGSAPLVIDQLPVPLPGIPAGVVIGGGVLYGVHSRAGTFITGKATQTIVDHMANTHLFPASFQAK